MVCDTIAVLDVDKHPNSPDGHVALAEIEAEHGKLETWLVHTPQAGRHYYFSQPKDKVRNLKRDGAGLEIRGDAGYVLLPGSSTPHGAYRWDPELHPHKIPRAALPAHVQAFVAGTPMKGNGKGNGPSWNTGTPPRECSSVPGKNPQKSANNGAGQLEHPYREMASGQLPKTALAEWFETEVREGGRNRCPSPRRRAHGRGWNAQAGGRGRGQMVVPASMPAAARWPGGRRDVQVHLQGRGQEADHRARRRRRHARPCRPFACTNSPRSTSRRGATCLGRFCRRRA